MRSDFSLNMWKLEREYYENIIPEDKERRNSTVPTTNDTYPCTAGILKEKSERI